VDGVADFYRKPRTSLRERAFAVFGRDEGLCVLQELKAAYETTRCDADGFEKWARRIVWKCQAIKDPNKRQRTRRRQTYIATCCKNIENTTPDTHPDDTDVGMDKEPQALNNVVAKIKGRTCLSEHQIYEMQYRLFEALAWRYDQRDPDCIYRARHSIDIMSKAVTKRYAMRYLQKVVENEQAESRKVLSKRRARR
jgi:hypothetical protein